MLARLAAFTVRRRRAVLVASLLLVVAAGAVGGSVPGLLSTGGFAAPEAESTRAQAIMEAEFGGGQPNLLLLVTAKNGTVDDPAVVAAGQDLAAELAAEGRVENVASYWSLGNAPPLRSTDGAQALIFARIAGEEGAVPADTEHLVEEYTRDSDVVAVGVGGLSAVFQEIQETIESDLARSEVIALPIVLLLLVAVFGGLVAGVLPLGVGIVSVLGTLGILRVMVEITEVSIFALNLTTALGLGIAIDYSLFIVSRFREERAVDGHVHAAVVRTVATAGRTVLFSAGTVAISLSALLLFPLAFLRSFAYAGVGVVVLSALGSVVLLPALLAVMGGRIDALSLRRGRAATPAGNGFWHRVATAVMRRPVPVATVVTLLLVVLGLPFLQARFSTVDDRVLPEEAASRQVSDQLRDGFASRESSTLSAVVPGYDPATDAGQLAAYASALSTVDGVARVDGAPGSFLGGRLVLPAGPAAAERFLADGATWLSVVPSVEPLSPEGEALVVAVRAVETPFEVLLGGAGAADVDSRSAIFARVPLAAALIGLVTFVVLFLMFGSLLVPAKAVVLNLLSLSATFGAMVWIFQQGHLSGLLDFTATGSIDVTTPILMFCIAFGLSMDYEVFLLSRIKEEHDHGLAQSAASVISDSDLRALNERAVALGLERTGRIVTAAAALLAVVFVAFAFSGITFIKMLGLGLALAVVMDATLVRGALVPAFMKLAGRANWWAPGPLRRLHERFGVSESAPPPAPAPRAEELV